MKFFTDFADLSGWKAESFLEGAFSVVLSKRIFISLMKIFDADSSKMTFFEDSIFYTVFCVVSTDSFKVIIEMFSYTYDFVLMQHEAKSFSLIKALLIPKKSIFSSRYDYR